MVLIEISIHNRDWSDNEGQSSYLKEIIPSIQLHLKRAIEATVVDQPNDPVRFISSYLGEHADEDYHGQHDENETKGISLKSFFCFRSNDDVKAPSSLNFPTVESLRQHIYSQSISSQKASDLLLRKLPAGPPTSRTGYLKSMEEIIGPNPLQSTSRKEWMMEWRQMYAEHKKIDSNDIDWNVIEFQMEKTFKRSISIRMGSGWDRDTAEAFTWLSSIESRNPMGKALGECSSRYSKCTYALIRALGCIKALHKESPPPPPGYRHLYGEGSLSEADEKWADIEKTDANGFKGLTANVFCRPIWKEKHFCNEGYCTRNENGTQSFVDSPIVRFLSEDDDEHGMHSGLHVSKNSTAFPPNTLFCLKNVYAPGEWMAPGGCYPNQRLLEVTATYRLSKVDVLELGASAKLCGDMMTLSYASRKTYIRGLSDILDKPLLTMEQEWSRKNSWKSYNGNMHCLQEEWDYVNCIVPPPKGSTIHEEENKLESLGTDPTSRDANNIGKSPEDFLEQTNLYIRQQREKYELCKKSLPEDHSELNLDEVLAVRLYTGPGFQPINNFLRQLGLLFDGTIRKSLALHVGLTFTATVGHLCRAVRKLSAATSPELVEITTYRGVRGMLPRSFWLPDEQDMVCAVDCGFVSTSTKKHVPMQFMMSTVTDSNSDEEIIPNILWKLEAEKESDSAFHSGASVKILSQYAAEEEILFPPCTMMVVKEKDDETQDESTSVCSRNNLPRHTERYHTSIHRGEVSFLTYQEITVKPYFI
jgi:hypothetical protein